jgi:predicted transcriptional regulator
VSVEPAERCVFLSIRPKYIDAILAHTKTVELRRSKIRAIQGTPLLLYSSTPVKAVVGVARIARIEEAAPEHLWAELGRSTGVTRDEFDTYFDGVDIGYGLHLTGVHRLPQPISLTALRDLGLEPPQSFRYLSGNQQHQLVRSAGLSPVGSSEAAPPDHEGCPRTPEKPSRSFSPLRTAKTILHRFRHSWNG